MKVLVISNLCPPDYDGGFELSALRNAESLRELGHEVELVTSEFRAEFQGDRTDIPGVSRIFVKTSTNDKWSNAEMFLTGKFDQRFKIGNLFRQFSLRFANIRGLVRMLHNSPKNEQVLDKFLEGREFDVAYVFGIHKIGTSVIHSLMKRNIPVVYHQGDEWLAYYIHPGILKRVLLNIASPRGYFRERRIDLRNIVLVSEFMKRRFFEAGFDEGQLDVIYRGVEFPIREDFERDRYGPPVFLIASRIALYKGTHFAIRAAAAFDKRAPEKEWQMWIAGHGDSLTMEYLSKLIASLKIGHRVKFIGMHTRKSTFETMQRATAVISPSVFDEPFGNTNIEALASGTVLIASRSGAIEEIIRHGKSGLIYDRYNVQELAHHMELVLDTPTMRLTLQAGGQERVRALFTQDQIMMQVEKKLMDVAGIPILDILPEAEKVTLQ